MTQPVLLTAQVGEGLGHMTVFSLWATNEVVFVLKCTTKLVSPVDWSANSPALLIVNGQSTVTQ